MIQKKPSVLCSYLNFLRTSGSDFKNIFRLEESTAGWLLACFGQVNPLVYNV
jgi:hypothetical protein